MADISQEIQSQIEILRKTTSVALGDFNDFLGRRFNGVREDILLYCLKRAIDIAIGCIKVAEANLPESAITLNRSLMESLFWVCWIAQSNEHAQIFADASLKELKRLARNVIKSGYGKVEDNTTREDKSQEFLLSSSMQENLKLKSIKDVAAEAGLERLYMISYSLVSLYVHGKAFGISSDMTMEEEVLTSIRSANTLMIAINLVVRNWIVRREQTSVSDIYNILHIY